jgi:hypothetical protein
MVSPYTLDGMLDHPLQDLFVLVAFRNEISDMDEDVFGRIVRDPRHETSVGLDHCDFGIVYDIL